MYKKGDLVKGAFLLEPTRVKSGKRTYRAWICRLQSNEIKIIQERYLLRAKRERRSPQEFGLNRIYSSYVKRCRNKNIFLGLTREEFHKISQRPCSYCGKPPSNGGGKNQPFVYNGLDRKDNRKGYTLDNSLPCCIRCNQIKSNLLSYEEMLAAARAILGLSKKATSPKRR